MLVEIYRLVVETFRFNPSFKSYPRGKKAQLLFAPKATPRRVLLCLCNVSRSPASFETIPSFRGRVLKTSDKVDWDWMKCEVVPTLQSDFTNNRVRLGSILDSGRRGQLAHGPV